VAFGRSCVSRLTDKVVIITGTAGGTGRAAALLFAAEGAHVVGCDIDAEGAAETVELAGGEMVSLAPLDLGAPESGGELVEEALRAHGRVDALYNNAAGIRIRPYDEVTLEDWHWTIRNELDLFHFVTSAAWRHLVASSGAIVNAASTTAIRGVGAGHFAIHGAAKGGVLGYTFHLAAAGAPHGVRANAVIPGVVRSPATERLGYFEGGEDSLAARIARANPLGRMCEPEDVARAALFLASDDAAYVTGVALPVDGGASRIQPGGLPPRRH
jgi:meso-butanediol dehydrogenase/(S,S)-butanediol dehydrogenase/diacetyl reductase